MMHIETIISKKAGTVGVQISYAKNINRKVESCLLPTASQAEMFINGKIKRFILETITSYTKQRKVALLRMESSYKSVQMGNSIDHILKELSYHNGSQLVVVMSAIWWLEKDLRLIAPSHLSPFYHYFETIINPLIEFCREQSASARIHVKTNS